MHSIYVDADFGDDERRQKLYDGDLFVYSPRPSTLALTEFAGELAREAFAPLDPETAQFDMAVEDYAALLAELKPRFIHHPESKRLIQAMLVDLGCDPGAGLLRRPADASSTSNDYLTTGIAFAFHPHRDTWYSAPYFQLNWWLPIFPISRGHGLAFHPKYWQTPVKNSSRVYNYAEWNATSRQIAATKIGTEPGCSRCRRKRWSWSRSSGRSASPEASSCSPARNCTPACRTRRADAVQHRPAHRAPGGRDGRPGRAEHRLGVHGYDDGRLPAGQ